MSTTTRHPVMTTSWLTGAWTAFGRAIQIDTTSCYFNLARIRISRLCRRGMRKGDKPKPTRTPIGMIVNDEGFFNGTVLSKRLVQLWFSDVAIQPTNEQLARLSVCIIFCRLVLLLIHERQVFPPL
jgi:hypothetical protein